MMLGYEHAGWAGLVAAGASFIAPATAIVLALAWAYVRFGTLPQTGWVLYGVEPVIVAVIADALRQLGRRALASVPRAALGAAVFALYLAGGNVFVLLFGGALVVTLARNAPRPRSRPVALPLAPLLGREASLASIFLEFLKLGALVYGSGYVLLAFLRSDVVERLGWLTQSQLVDAVAIGQVTPGPVFTTATFVGYLAHGVAGALLATLGIFLPAFALAAIVYALLPRLRRSPWASAFLDGVTVSALGLMAGVTVQLGRVVLVDAFTVALALVTFAALRRFHPNSAYLVVGGALVGIAVRGIG